MTCNNKDGPNYRALAAATTRAPESSYIKKAQAKELAYDTTTFSLHYSNVLFSLIQTVSNLRFVLSGTGSEPF